MSFLGGKSPFRSLTLIGAFLALVSGLEQLHVALSAVPIEFLPPKAQAAVAAALTVTGSVLAIVGRFRASEKIGL